MIYIMFFFFLGMLIWQRSINKQEESIQKDRRKAEEAMRIERIRFNESLDAERTRMIAELNAKRNDMLFEIATVRDNAMSEVRIERDSLEKIKQSLEKYERDIDLIINNTIQSNPHLSTQIADAQYYLDMRSYQRLLQQNRPALKAAEEVRKIADEKRQLMQQNRQIQYQLDFYEKLIPWLEEFKEVPSDEAVSYATNSYGSEYDAIKKWLSPEDYEKLSNTDKYQRALNNWKNRKKAIGTLVLSMNDISVINWNAKDTRSVTTV